jgi:hypothetical protein
MDCLVAPADISAEHPVEITAHMLRVQAAEAVIWQVMYLVEQLLQDQLLLQQNRVTHLETMQVVLEREVQVPVMTEDTILHQYHNFLRIKQCH